MTKVFRQESERRGTFEATSIYYGESKGLAVANIFAKVLDSDKNKLIALGKIVWKNGSQ